MAFRALALNALQAANQCYGDRLRIFPVCVYDKVRDIIMRDANGGSISSVRIASEVRSSEHVQREQSSGPAQCCTEMCL